MNVSDKYLGLCLVVGNLRVKHAHVYLRRLGYAQTVGQVLLLLLIINRALN